MTVEIYMVGGCVRDRIMGQQPKDIDYVVVGADHCYMIENGFDHVGQSFPIYIGEDGNEYALARFEKSTGDGYGDFEFEIENINPELLGKFISMGYNPDKEYDVEELITVLQRISQ